MSGKVWERKGIRLVRMGSSVLVEETPVMSVTFSKT